MECVLLLDGRVYVLGVPDRDADVNRRLFIGVALLVLVSSAFAVLPAILFVEEAVSVIGGLVLRQAGKEAVMTLGTAANDATWATATTVSGASGSSIAANVIAFLGLGTLSGSTTDEKYQVPLKAGVTIPRPPLTGLGTGTQSPLNSAVRFAAGTFSSDSYTSTAGAVVPFKTTTTTTGAELVAAFAAWKNSCATAGPCGGWVYQNFQLVARTDLFVIVTYSGTSYTFNQAEIAFQAKGPGGTAFDNFVSSTKFTPTLSEPSDGIKRFSFVSSKWAPDASDPDWSAAEVAASVPASRLAIRGKNAAALDVRVDLSVDPSNQVRVDSLTQVEADKVMQRSLTFNASLQPSQASQQVTNSATVANYYDQFPAQNPQQTGQTFTVAFPDDYARQGTLASIDTSTTAIKNALTQTTTAPVLTDNTTALTDGLSWGSTFSGILGWTMPAHTSTCPVLDYAQVIAGTDLHVHMDKHCQLIEDNVRGPLSSVMSVVWLLVAFFIVMGA